MSNIAAAQIALNSTLAQKDQTVTVVPPATVGETPEVGAAAPPLDAAADKKSTKIASDYDSIVQRLKSGSTTVAKEDDIIRLIQHDKALELLGGIVPNSPEDRNPGTWTAGRSGMVTNDEKLFGGWVEGSIETGGIRGYRNYNEFKSKIQAETGISAHELFNAVAKYKQELFLDPNAVDSLAKLPASSISNIPEGLNIVKAQEVLRFVNNPTGKEQSNFAETAEIPENLLLADADKKAPVVPVAKVTPVESSKAQEKTNSPSSTSELLNLLPSADRPEVAMIALTSDRDIAEVTKLVQSLAEGERSEIAKLALASDKDLSRITADILNALDEKDRAGFLKNFLSN